MKNVAVIALLAVVTELLLPGEGMARYVQLVMGLFVIVSVLTPLLGVLERKTQFEVSAWSLPAREEQWRGIKSQGEEVAKKAGEIALEEYRKKVAGQIEAMAGLVPGVAWARAEVVVSGENGSRWGSLEKVALTVGRKEQAEKGREAAGPPTQPLPGAPAQPDREPLQKPETVGREEDGNMKEKVRETILNFYSLKPGQLVVTIGGAAQENNTLPERRALSARR